MLETITKGQAETNKRLERLENIVAGIDLKNSRSINALRDGDLKLFDLIEKTNAEVATASTKIGKLEFDLKYHLASDGKYTAS